MKRVWESPAACRFFTPEDVVRWALAAYYGASRDIEPPAGEPWIDPESGSWATPAAFGRAVHARFTNALVAASIDAHIPCDHGCASEEYSWDDRGFPGSHSDYLRAKFPDLFGVPENEPFAASENGRDNQAEKGVIRA